MGSRIGFPARACGIFEGISRAGALRRLFPLQVGIWLPQRNIHDTSNSFFVYFFQSGQAEPWLKILGLEGNQVFLIPILQVHIIQDLTFGF